MTEDGLKNIPQYLRLSDRIATTRQPNREQLQTVAEAGFEVAINLGLHDTEHSLSDEANEVSR